MTEDWDVKKCVYERLDRVVPARGLLRSEHVVLVDHADWAVSPAAGERRGHALHESRPPDADGRSDPRIADIGPDARRRHQLLARLNKTAVVVNDWPGFVSSRLSHVFMNEAAFALQEGVATAEQIDTIFKKCYGHKMGPLETADLIGLDTVVRSLKVLYESFQDSKYRCCPLLQQLVHAGHLGRKTGRGFYRYPERL